jgi:hypothetical protein
VYIELLYEGQDDMSEKIKGTRMILQVHTMRTAPRRNTQSYASPKEGVLIALLLLPSCVRMSAT